MVRVSGEQLQKTSGLVRAEARRAPVEVTYHGRAELVILSVEDYALLRENRKIAFTDKKLPRAKAERIALNKMASEHDALNALMDD